MAGEGAASFVIDRSADGITGVVIENVLLLESGSAVVLLTAAVFRTAAIPSGTVPLICRAEKVLPGCRVPMEKEPLHLLQVAPPSVEYRGFYSSLNMAASVISTFSAASGPRLFTEIS